MQNKVLFTIIVAVLMPAMLQAQDEDEEKQLPSFERKRSLFFQLKAAALTGGHKQAAYYDGTHTTFTFYNLYSIPVIYNDINASTGYNTYLGEFPPQMRFQWSIQLSASVMYYINPSTAVFFRFNGNRTTASGVFSLFADDPANQYGEPLVFGQQMRGLELRTWYLPGIRFESEPLTKGEINPFFEIALIGGGIKPLRNEAIVQGKKYNLFNYDPNFATDVKLRPGYGLFVSLGLISWVKSSTAIELSADLSWVRLRTLDAYPNAFYTAFTVGFTL